VQFYIVIGYCIRLKEDYLFENRKIALFISIIIYASLIWASMHFYPGKCLDVHLNKYYNIPICFLLIVTGCVGVFLFFKKLNISPRWLVYIGQNTFVIYMLHGYAINTLPKLLKYINVHSIVPLQFEALLRTVSGCIICCIIAMFINHYCPFVAGKKQISK
jgi:fucose 4-O-acetylase-like acetyltransferase